MIYLKASPYDVLCFCHLRWNFVFQRPQHLMMRWAQVARVFYIEESLFKAGKEGLHVSRCPKTDVFIVTPVMGTGTSKERMDAQLSLWLNKLIEDYRISSYVSWYYTPMALPYTKHLSPKGVVYDCMDELSNFKDAHETLKDKEKELCAFADVMFTGGHTLYLEKKKLSKNIHPFPSSVDVPHFVTARAKQADPEDQKKIPFPRLGFFGVIDERLDLKLLDELSKNRPDWQIVLVGPVVKISPDTLPRRSNIHYLGQKSYEDLPRYLSGWDVALLPFARNDSTKFISPTKTPEYLAGGKPVVSTSIRDVVFPYGEKGFVRIADDATGFEEAIERCLKDELAQEEIDHYLSKHSWNKTWDEMAEFLHQAILFKNHKKVPENRLTEGFDRRVVQPIKPIFDYLVVGAGFAGSVIAERLASHGKKIMVCDKRPHIGGNAYDCPDADGILVHKYGPHIFHTDSSEVFEYLSNFTEWRPYEHRVLSQVDGKLLPMPINLDTINGLYGLDLDSEGLEQFFKRVAEPREEILTSEDVIISKVGKELYEKFFKSYTFKQWGLWPSQIDATVISRIPVRTNRDDRYFTDTYQAMPKHGFTNIFKNLLSHPNIKLELGTDHKAISQRILFKKMIYTGQIDQFFDCCYGKLPYRSIDFKFETYPTKVFQKAAVINYPNEHAYTRITEFKYLTGQEHPKTSVVYEFPRAEGEGYYPIPTAPNMDLYRKYHALAERTKNIHFLGRLGTYKYYNIDQVILQALLLSSKIMSLTVPEVALT